MSKKLKNLKWETVALDGFPASMTENFHGFVGLEECTSYGLDKEVKRSKKKKPEKKQQNTDIADNQVEKKKKKPEKKRQNTDIENNQVEKKKVKLSNGFIVETIESVTPSQTNKICNEKKEKEGKNKQINNEKQDNTKIETKTPVNINAKKTKAKLGEDITQVVSDLTAEDMLTWAEFKLPESIMKALTELGFKQPTKIQQLSLPAAIHGRRDILGAAETGSGKTLAFGLPILSGILKLKEKAATKGLDVYDIPYRKPLSKRKDENIPVEVNKGKGKKDNKKGKQKEVKAKESSEDGYSSGKESDEEEVSEEEDNEESGEDSAGEEKDEEEVSEEEDNEESSEDTAGEEKDEEFLEEYDVPIRKKETSTDEGNESDNSDNYIHLSDMLDSDDLADSSGDEESSDLNDEVQSDDDAEVSDDDNDASEVDDEPDVEGQGEEDDNEEGIGCVKVLDNIEIPGHVVTKTGKPLYALILTPTRELAIQISRHLIAAAKYTGIRVATIVGGMAAVKQERVLRSGPEIVVATPGRLWELVTQGQPHLQQLDSVKFLAIDETDRMIERGHFEELHPLLERLNVDDARRSARQNFVFSATLTLVHDLPVHMKGKKVTKRGKILNRKIEKMTPEQKVNRLVKMIGMTDPKVVDITSKNLGTAETLTESRIACSLEHKDAYLYYIIKRHPGRTLVFCNSIGSVKRLAQLFTLLRCSPLPLHASMPQRQRLKNLERFRDSAHSVLIATDVAARGLDVPHVSHVVHYQVPRTAENYVHRSGRTARAAREGLTILLMEPKEAYLYNKLCRTLNKTSELPTFPVTSQTLSPIMDLMKLAREVDALELKRRRAAQAHGWRERVAREMDIIVDDDDVPVKEIDPSIEKALKVKKRQLDAMLSRPVYPRGFSFKYPTLNDPAALSMPEENALQVMKNAIESGELKKEKRKSKNAPLLKLQKTFSRKNKNKMNK